jgi:hypothetical protein
LIERKVSRLTGHEVRVDWPFSELAPAGAGRKGSRLLARRGDAQLGLAVGDEVPAEVEGVAVRSVPVNRNGGTGYHWLVSPPRNP